MQFWKMNGAGNDFIILNNLEEKIPEEQLPALARQLCHRRLSIGADGLMAVAAPEKDGDIRMLFYNSDGSAGEMCGNGARCICRYAYERGLAGEVQKVETPSGTVTGWRVDRRRYRIRLNPPTKVELQHRFRLDGGQMECGYVELGTPGLPHAVVSFPGLRTTEENSLRPLAESIRRLPDFPKGANVNFYEQTGPDTLYEKTFERGVEDFTMACGTGTGSVVTVLTLRGIVSGKNVQVDMAGGRLCVDTVREGDRITELYLTGPTNIACTGEVRDEDWMPPTA